MHGCPQGRCTCRADATWSNWAPVGLWIRVEGSAHLGRRACEEELIGHVERLAWDGLDPQRDGRLACELDHACATRQGGRPRRQGGRSDTAMARWRRRCGAARQPPLIRVTRGSAQLRGVGRRLRTAVRKAAQVGAVDRRRQNLAIAHHKQVLAAPLAYHPVGAERDRLGIPVGLRLELDQLCVVVVACGSAAHARTSRAACRCMAHTLTAPTAVLSPRRVGALSQCAARAHRPPSPCPERCLAPVGSRTPCSNRCHSQTSPCRGMRPIPRRARKSRSATRCRPCRRLRSRAEPSAVCSTTRGRCRGWSRSTPRRDRPPCMAPRSGTSCKSPVAAA
eukprot:3476476-Prymnesium_polylepis.1